MTIVQSNFYNLSWGNQALIFDYAAEDNGLFINNIANYFFQEMILDTTRQPLSASSVTVIIEKYNLMTTTACEALRGLYPRLKFAIKGTDPDDIARNIFNQFKDKVSQDPDAAMQNLKNSIAHYFQTNSFDCSKALYECEIKPTAQLIEWMILYPATADQKVHVLDHFRHCGSVEMANELFLTILCNQQKQKRQILNGFFATNILYSSVRVIFCLKEDVATQEMDEKIAKWYAAGRDIKDLISLAKASNRALFVLIHELFHIYNLEAFNTTLQEENLATEEMLVLAVDQARNANVKNAPVILDCLEFQLAFRLLAKCCSELRPKYLQALFTVSLELVRAQTPDLELSEDEMWSTFSSHFCELTGLVQNPAS